MCILCIEIQKQRMTNIEVARAYTEMSIDDDHFVEVLNTIDKNYDIEEVLEVLIDL